MVTAPLFAVLLIATAVALKVKAVKFGAVFLGVALGLSLASTTIGGPILDALTSACANAIDMLVSVAGA
jgi:hypothetical protein